MKITVIGTGYVGLVSGVCYAELGHDVTCVDNDTDKIVMLQNGRIPIYEPGLDVLVKKNLQNGRLTFSDRFNQYTTDGDIVIIAVGTPSLPNGEADLRYIEQAVREVAHNIKEYTIVVIRAC